MKILVTGGTGYLGGRLAQYLSTFSEYEVCLGTRKKTDRLPCLFPGKTVEMKWDSISQLRRICRNIDLIIHAAGMNAADCNENPEEAVKCNALGTAQILKAAKTCGVKRFIYLSTAHVYASPLVGNITEEVCPRNLHPYASSHRAGEDVVRRAHQESCVEGVVIRLANVFGAPVSKAVNCWMLLVNDICKQAVTQRKIQLNSSGQQRRNFVSMNEFCRAIVHMLELPLSHLGDGLFNIGGARSWTVMEMATFVSERAERILDKKVEISPLISPKNESIEELDYDVSKFLKTGFEPSKEIAVETEVNNLIQFCLEHFNPS
jgi:UDP-glucose 4-epimerase